MAYTYAWKSILNPGKAVDFFSKSNRQSFETNNTEFSQDNAWLLSELSRLIYLKSPSETGMEDQTTTRNSFLSKIGLEERWFYNGKHLQCAIMGAVEKQKRNFSILVFRGTQGRFSNWCFNLNTLLSQWPSGGKVHRGFKLILTQAWEEIQQQLDSISEPVYYTGHSLGGALAVLAASLKKPEAVYTFGSPRIGNLDFVNSTNDIRIYRVFTSNDIVAGVPPFPGIMHVGEPHTLTGSKEPYLERSLFEAPGFLADHSPLNYTFQL